MGVGACVRNTVIPATFTLKEQPPIVYGTSPTSPRSPKSLSRSSNVVSCPPMYAVAGLPALSADSLFTPYNSFHHLPREAKLMPHDGQPVEQSQSANEYSSSQSSRLNEEPVSPPAKPKTRYRRLSICASLLVRDLSSEAEDSGTYTPSAFRNEIAGSIPVESVH